MRQTYPVLNQVLNLLSDGYRSLNPFNGPAGFTSLSLSPPEHPYLTHLTVTAAATLRCPFCPSFSQFLNAQGTSKASRRRKAILQLCG